MLEPRRWKLQGAKIVPLCSSLGNRARLCLKKKEKRRMASNRQEQERTHTQQAGMDKDTHPTGRGRRNSYPIENRWRCVPNKGKQEGTHI